MAALFPKLGIGIDAEAEVQLNSALASTAPWLPYMARYSLQQKFGDALHMDFLENSDRAASLLQARHFGGLLCRDG